MSQIKFVSFMTLENNKNLVSNYQSSKYSWLKSGGKIDNLYKIYNFSELSSLFNRKQLKTKSLLVIGNLSNTLIKMRALRARYKTTW